MAHADDPADLLPPLLAGEAAAVDAFCRAQHPVVHRLCLGFLADAAGADDAAQDALLLLLDRIAKWDPRRPFACWRNALVLNHCRDRLRRARRRDRAETEAGRSRREVPLPHPEVELGRAEVRSVLERALATLPVREREAFVLRDLEGQDTDAVAEAMGVTAATVRSLTTLARRRLRELLARTLDADPEAEPEVRRA